MMNNGRFEIRIRRPVYKHALEIIIGKTEGSRLYVAKPVELELVEVEEGGEIPATLTIGGLYEQDFLRAMSEALDGTDFRTARAARLEGTLEATRAHLGDLRKMLKLEKR